MNGGKLWVQEILQAQEHILIRSSGKKEKKKLSLFSYLCDNKLKKGGIFAVAMLLFHR
jgi:hypothetical protein